MKPFDDLPQRNITHDIAQDAETAFIAAIKKCKLFVDHKAEGDQDYGTDFLIEAREGESMTNIRAHVQLKGTNSKTNSNGTVSVAVPRRNLNYLLTQPNSIYVCYHLPSKRLLTRYADDVYHEYERRGTEWSHQDSVTINFSQLFDEEFQRRLQARLIAHGKSSRDERLQWVGAPPEHIPTLAQNATAVIDVPSDPVRARQVLDKLYQAGQDIIISKHFDQFAAILDSLPGGMDPAYLAEINLGINHHPFDEDRIKQSIKVIKMAMERGNIHVGSLLYCLGNAWLALGNHNKAKEIYKKALIQLDTLDMSNIAAKCCKNLGSSLERLGEDDEARAFYDRALELDPDLSEAHFALAHWHRRKGYDLNTALEHLDRVIRQDGSAVEMATVHGWRIDLLFNTGHQDDAFREINSLLCQANRPDWIWPWCAKHVAQFGKASPETVKKAIHFWRAYLREHPKDMAAERERLLCLWRLRSVGAHTGIDFNEFKDAVIRLIESGDQDSAFLWDRIGHWAQYDGNWVQAEIAYRKAWELEPTRYGYCLGTALNFLGRYQEALSILTPQAEEYMPDAMSWFQVARAREGVGDFNGGIMAYQKAIELDADYDLAWFNLGGMYWNSKDIHQAIEIWRDAVKRFPNHELTQKLRQKYPAFFKSEQ